MVVYTNYADIYEIFGLMMVSISLIFSYGKLRSLFPNYKDPLMIKLNIYDLDLWSFLHLAWYTFLGYTYPAYDIEIFLMGVTWEGIEHGMGKYRPSWMGGFVDCPDNINVLYNKNWWYGRKSDIVMNLLGFYCGKLITY